VRETGAAVAQQLAVEQYPLVAHCLLGLRCLELDPLRRIMAPMPIGDAEFSLDVSPASTALERVSVGSMRPMLGRLSDLLVPPVCISGGKHIGSHGLLCGACFASIDFIAPPLCARLGVPLPFEAGEPPLLSAAAIASPSVYDRARSAARY
jgi:Double zinc ribbon domain